jgi:mono/diheme cytochrome c family protein
MNTRIIKSIAVFMLVFVCQSSFAQTKWVSPAAANDVKNPVGNDASALKSAKNLYISMCAPCHGNKGRGDGPAAPALNPHPADHSSKTVQSETDGSLYWKLTTGKGPMQSFKAKLSDEQRWSLVNYIRTLKK